MAWSDTPGLYEVVQQLDEAVSVGAADVVLVIQGAALKRTTAAAVAAATAPALRYVALLTQSGSSAPVPTILENTLGGAPVWSYIAAGVYDATLAGAFLADKVFAPRFCFYSTMAGVLVCVNINRTSDNVLRMEVTDNGGAPLDLEDTGIPISFAVYP